MSPSAPGCARDDQSHPLTGAVQQCGRDLQNTVPSAVSSCALTSRPGGFRLYNSTIPRISLLLVPLPLPPPATVVRVLLAHAGAVTSADHQAVRTSKVVAAVAPPSGSVSFSDRRRLGPRQILPIEHQQDARAGAWRRWPRAKLNPPRGPLPCSLSVLRLLSCHRRSRRAMSTTIASTSLIRVQVQPANSGARCLGVLGSRCALCDPQAVAITPHPSPLLPRWDPAPPRHQGLVDGIVEAPRLLRIVGASAGGLLEPTNPPVIRRHHPFVGIARSLSSRPRRRRAWPRKRRQLLTINSCAAARRTRRRAVRAPRGCSGDAAANVGG